MITRNDVARMIAAGRLSSGPLSFLDDLGDDQIPPWVRHQLNEMRVIGEREGAHDFHARAFAYCEHCVGLRPCQIYPFYGDRAMPICASCSISVAPPIWWAPIDLAARIFGPEVPHPFPTAKGGCDREECTEMPLVTFPLSNGETFKVDAAVADLVSQFTWHSDRRGGRTIPVTYVRGCKIELRTLTAILRTSPEHEATSIPGETS